MKRLEPVVHPLALPGDRPTAGRSATLRSSSSPEASSPTWAREGPLVAKAPKALGGPDTSDVRGARRSRPVELASRPDRAGGADGRGRRAGGRRRRSGRRARPRDRRRGGSRAADPGNRRAGRRARAQAAATAREAQPPAGRRRDGDRGAVPAGDLAERRGALGARDRPGSGRGRAAPRRALAQPPRAPAAQETDGTPGVDERNDQRRIVRAIWARDRETSIPDWQTNKKPPHTNDDPFRMSLDAADRHMLVRQTRGDLARLPRSRSSPSRWRRRALWLSALGAWLDLHGAWTTKPYSRGGHDLDPRVGRRRADGPGPVRAGRLPRLPLSARAPDRAGQGDRAQDEGRLAVLAGLYQRKFLVIGEPVRTYSDTHDFPFLKVGIRPAGHAAPRRARGRIPPRTRTGTSGRGSAGSTSTSCSTPSTTRRPVPPRRAAALGGGAVVRRASPRSTPSTTRTRTGRSRRTARRSRSRRCTRAETPCSRRVESRCAAKATLGDSRPHMSQAKVSLPAVAATVGHRPGRRSRTTRCTSQGGFDGTANNTGEVWAAMPVDLADRAADRRGRPLPRLRFGAGARPAATRRGVPRAGPADPRAVARSRARSATWPAWRRSTSTRPQFLKGALPKLFGLVDLGRPRRGGHGRAAEDAERRLRGARPVEGLLADLQPVKAAAAERGRRGAASSIDRAASKTDAAPERRPGARSPTPRQLAGEGRERGRRLRRAARHAARPGQGDGRGGRRRRR